MAQIKLAAFLKVIGFKKKMKTFITLISISAAVFFVNSRFSTRALSLKMLSPADESLIRRSSSSDFSKILYSFCWRVNSAFCSSRSGIDRQTSWRNIDNYIVQCRSRQIIYIYDEIQSLGKTRPGLSSLTTSASSWYSKPCRVTVKLINVVCACNSKILINNVSNQLIHGRSSTLLNHVLPDWR